MFGMEKLATGPEDKEKEVEKKALLESFIDKEAKDHYHMDSEGKKTSPSIHDEGKEEKPHKHNLKGGGETDKRPSGQQHVHKEKDEDGGKTGPAIKTAFQQGFEKSALSGKSKALLGLGALGSATAIGAGLGDKEVSVKMPDGKKKKMTRRELARKAYRAAHGKDYK